MMEGILPQYPRYPFYSKILNLNPRDICHVFFLIEEHIDATSSLKLDETVEDVILFLEGDHHLYIQVSLLFNFLCHI